MNHMRHLNMAIGLYFLVAITWMFLTDLGLRNSQFEQPLLYICKELFLVVLTAGFLGWIVRQHHELGLHACQEQNKTLKTYTQLFSQHGLPQLLINPQNGRIVEANQSAATYYGWSRAQLCAMSITEINTLKTAEVYAQMNEACHQQRNFFRFRHRLSSGEMREVEVYSHPVQLYSQVLLYSIIVDITEKHKARLALKRSNRMLKSFVESIRAMMHCHDKQAIAQAVTQALVEEGHYAMAWIGVVPSQPHQPIQVLSKWGDTLNYIDNITITWDTSDAGNEPTGRAIKLQQSQITHDIASDESYRIWQQHAMQNHFRSNAVFPLFRGGQVFAVLSLYATESDAFDDEEVNYLEALASELARTLVTVESVQNYERVDAERLAAISRSKAALLETVATLSNTLEHRDPYTAGHQRRVAWLAVKIGEVLQLSQEQLETLDIVGLLHDIGKISIPSEILSKPGRISAVEFELIKQHPIVGESLLSKVSFTAPIAQIVGQHHENLDGSGYPRGLTAEHILLETRILTVADVMEAMISHRPYRPGLPLEHAKAELNRGIGSKYDEAVVNACFNVMETEGYQLTTMAMPLLPV